MLLLSSSSLKTFKDCKKAYQIGFEYMLDPYRTTEAVENGTSFHEIVAKAAIGGDWHREADMYNPMLEVAEHYIAHNPLPRVEEVLLVERPIWTEIIPDVWLRCTFDLVYRDGNEIVGRDYKTFQKKPTLDLDLDFQGRIYTAALQRKFPDSPVRFEYEYVRQTPPGVAHNQRGDLWSPAECYFHYPLIMPREEMNALWQETEWAAQDILDKQANGRWYREDAKGFGGCGSCFYKDLCKAEVQQGQLDAETIAMLAKQREPLALPEMK